MKTFFEVSDKSYEAENIHAVEPRERLAKLE